MTDNPAKLSLVLALLACLPAPAGAEPKARAAPPELAAVRAVVAEVDGLINRRKLRVARFSIGGGQNPARFVVHFAGGSEKDYMRDPYAAPFQLRRVKREITLPAVGDASATIYFDGRGQAVFVHCTGADTMGVGPHYALRPTSQLRAYFSNGQAARVIYTGSDEDDPDQTVDLSLEKDPRRKARAAAAGEAILRRATALRTALTTLAE